MKQSAGTVLIDNGLVLLRKPSGGFGGYSWTFSKGNVDEGETLEEIKARLKPKKSANSIDMLDTANTYDDKVAVIRMLVSEDSKRVASVLKNMIKQ